MSKSSGSDSESSWELVQDDDRDDTELEAIHQPPLLSVDNSFQAASLIDLKNTEEHNQIQDEFAVLQENEEEVSNFRRGLTKCQIDVDVQTDEVVLGTDFPDTQFKSAPTSDAWTLAEGENSISVSSPSSSFLQLSEEIDSILRYRKTEQGNEDDNELRIETVESKPCNSSLRPDTSQILEDNKDLPRLSDITNASLPLSQTRGLQAHPHPNYITKLSNFILHPKINHPLIIIIILTIFGTGFLIGNLYNQSRIKNDGNIIKRLNVELNNLKQTEKRPPNMMAKTDHIVQMNALQGFHSKEIQKLQEEVKRWEISFDQGKSERDELLSNLDIYKTEYDTEKVARITSERLYKELVSKKETENKQNRYDTITINELKQTISKMQKQASKFLENIAFLETRAEVDAKNLQNNEKHETDIVEIVFNLLQKHLMATISTIDLQGDLSSLKLDQLIDNLKTAYEKQTDILKTDPLFIKLPKAIRKYLLNIITYIKAYIEFVDKSEILDVVPHHWLRSIKALLYEMNHRNSKANMFWSSIKENVDMAIKYGNSYFKSPHFKTQCHSLKCFISDLVGVIHGIINKTKIALSDVGDKMFDLASDIYHNMRRSVWKKYF